jgi:hypothetical protein
VNATVLPVTSETYDERKATASCSCNWECVHVVGSTFAIGDSTLTMPEAPHDLTQPVFWVDGHPPCNATGNFVPWSVQSLT